MLPLVPIPYGHRVIPSISLARQRFSPLFRQCLGQQQKESRLNVELTKADLFRTHLIWVISRVTLRHPTSLADPPGRTQSHHA